MLSYLYRAKESGCLFRLLFDDIDYLDAALVKVDEKELTGTNQVQLYPGMAVTVMIPSKERTALDDLIGPVVASFDQPFRQK